MIFARLWLTFRQRREIARLTAEQRAQAESVLIAAYREVFGGERGRLVLADIFRRSGLMARGYSPGEPAETAIYREGRRSIALEIVEMVNRDPAAALEMARSGEVADLYAEGAGT